MEQSAFDKLAATARDTLMQNFDAWRDAQIASDYTDEIEDQELLQMFLESIL